MKNFTIMLMLLLASTFIFGQSSKTKKLIQSIEGQWTINVNNNVSYTKVIHIDSVLKDELFKRISNYFVYAYGSGKAVIQNKDKHEGLIIGKGLYLNVFQPTAVTPPVGAWHILRVDVKDYSARIILTLTDYKDISYNENSISYYYPIGNHDSYKNMFGKAFYSAHMHAQATLIAVEKALKIENVNNSEW